MPDLVPGPAATHGRGALAFAAMALAYYTASSIGLLFVSQPEAIAAFWPASGVYVAALALRPRAEWGWLAAGVFVANVAANLQGGNPLPLSGAFAVANTAEGLVAIALLARTGPLPLRVGSLAGVARLAFLAAPVGAAVGAGLGAPAVALLTGAPLLKVALVWWAADALGILLLAPVVMSWLARGIPERPFAIPARHQAEGAAVVAVTLVPAAVVFSDLGTATGVLPYVVLPGMAWAAVRGGPRAGSLALLAVAAVAVGATEQGFGPFTAAGATMADRILGVQAYVAVFGLTTLVLAATRDERLANQAALEASERRVRTVTDAAHDAIVGADHRGLITFWNPAAERLFGWRQEEVMGQPLTRLMPARFHQPHTEGLARHAAGGPARLVGRTAELEALHRGGHEVPVELSLAAWQGPGGVHYTAVVRDITQRRAAEAERRAAYERERELERLRDMDAFRRNLMNMAAHELRTPLTPLRLQVQSLAQALRGRGEAGRALGILERNVERLARLVDDLMVASRIDAGRLQLHRRGIDARELVEDAVQDFRPVAEAAGVALALAPGPPVAAYADPERLTQVLFNLLSNALKFTGPGGRVDVAVGWEGDEVLVSVADTGAGLERDELAVIFQPFGQGRAGVAQGSGLGLHISRGIVEQHGGKLWAESLGPGRGSRFSFTLPLSPEPGAAEPEEPPAAPGRAPSR